MKTHWMTLLCMVLLATPFGRTADKVVSPIVECRVVFGEGSGPLVEVRITDSELIRFAVERPLANAKPDTVRAEWKVVVTVKLKRKDGSEDGIVLFSPWGYIKADGRAQVADLSLLKKTVRSMLEASLADVK
jgi:hypothetical protein